MLDLVDELLEVLEPFNTPIGSWRALRHQLGTEDWDLICRRSLSIYLQDRTAGFKIMYGRGECDAGIRDLVGVHDALIRAGRLTGDSLVDDILIYAAHLGALSSYGPAVWDRCARVLLQAQMTVKEKELKR